MIYGVHAVRALLEYQPQRVKVLFLLKGRHDDLAAMAAEYGISVERVNDAQLSQKCEGQVHQGVAAEASPPSLLPEKWLLDRLSTESSVSHKILVLDGVEDPHNLGACLRSAEAFGVTAVVIPSHGSCGLTPAVCKVAVGAAEIVPVVQAKNLARFLEELKKHRVWIKGFAAPAQVSLSKCDLKGHVALVFGSEGLGLRSLTSQVCDEIVEITMQGAISSLNVSVAVGIVLYEASRQQ
jgi:23S rRNA (guanosine2251-2'-O)-methyltransferase